MDEDRVVCSKCGRTWSARCASAGEQCGVRIEALEWCRGVLVAHGDDPRDARIAELEAELTLTAADAANLRAERLLLARVFDAAATRDLDCGDNSCRFKAHGKGGMRTNGGCSCLGAKDGVWGPFELARAVEAARRIVAEAESKEVRGG